MIGKQFFLNAREGAFSEVPEDGQTHHSFQEITGHLVRAAFKETNSGETLRLHIVNELNFYVISMFVRSRVANSFMLLAKNLNIHEPMKFKIERKADPKSGGLKDCLSVHQNGNSVRWYYTQENAQELPVMPEDKRAFLRKIIETELTQALEKKMNPFPNHIIYKPFGSGKGLQGGYFNDYASTAKVVGPVSRYERQAKKSFGNNRPL